MDEADYAAEIEEQDRMLAREAAKRVQGVGLRPIGTCYYCYAQLSHRLFCDHDCAKDWQAEQDARRRNYGSDGLPTSN